MQLAVALCRCSFLAMLMDDSPVADTFGNTLNVTKSIKMHLKG